MIKDVLIDVGNGEIRLAILEDGVVSEIRVEKDEEKSLVGNIYKGKVLRVILGMQSAFVDIGHKKNAYLYVKDALPVKYNKNDDVLTYSGSLPDITELLTQGQELTVQVIKDAVGEKGPRVTTRVSLPGRYTVFFPYENSIGISKKIDDQEERQRLKEIAMSIKPSDSGLVLRTSSENIDKALLAEEINVLSSLWESIEEQEKKSKAPELLYSEQGIIEHTIREQLSSSDRFLVNHRRHIKIYSLF